MTFARLNLKKLVAVGAVVLLLGFVCLSRAAAIINYYGVDGYNVIGDVAQYPSYATVTVHDVDSTITWAGSTADERALLKPNSLTGDRIAAAWSTYQRSFDVEVEITDGQTHQVSLYFVDWDSQNRAQRIAAIEMSDPNGTLKDYRLVDSFSGGIYLTYNISGRVIFRVWRESAADAVLSGIFFQPASNGIPSPTPTPLATPTPSPTPVSTPTPTATPTPTPTPCSTLPNGKLKKGCVGKT
jgi:hypothetical protein